MTDHSMRNEMPDERRQVITRRECDKCNQNIKEDLDEMKKQLAEFHDKFKAEDERWWKLGVGIIVILSGIVISIFLQVATRPDTKAIAAEVTKEIYGK